MWWYIKKILDSTEKVVYSYGFETKEQTGKIEFNKITQQFLILQIADGDSVKGVQRLFLQPLYGVITRESYPNERQIAIG